MRVHKVTLMVVDFDVLGETAIKDVIENQKYPNYCIGPEVMRIESREVDWSDDHPLNSKVDGAAAFWELFGGVG